MWVKKKQNPAKLIKATKLNTYAGQSHSDRFKSKYRVLLVERWKHIAARRLKLINKKKHLNTILITFNRSKLFKWIKVRLMHCEAKCFFYTPANSHHTFTYLLKICKYPAVTRKLLWGGWLIEGINTLYQNLTSERKKLVIHVISLPGHHVLCMRCFLSKHLFSVGFVFVSHSVTIFT